MKCTNRNVPANHYNYNLGPEIWAGNNSCPDHIHGTPRNQQVGGQSFTESVCIPPHGSESPPALPQKKNKVEKTGLAKRLAGRFQSYPCEDGPANVLEQAIKDAGGVCGIFAQIGRIYWGSVNNDL